MGEWRRTNGDNARCRWIAYNMIPVLYCNYNTGIILDYSNIYAWYYIICMHEYGYSMLWYGISTYD
jgi:hypothetical protein